MRNSKLILVFLLPSLFSMPTVATAQEQSRTIISGTPEPNASVVYLSKVDYLNQNEPEILIDTVSNNSFSFALDIDQPQLYRLFTNADTLAAWTTPQLPELLRSYGYYYYNCYGYYKDIAEVFVLPGESLQIHLIFNKRGRNNSEYRGDRAEENNFLAKYRAKSQNTRGLWAYTFFGTGAYYKDRPPEKIIKKSTNERRKIQNKIERQESFCMPFTNYLTNENTASAFQMSSNVLNYIDSLDIRLYFENAENFQTYTTLYASKVSFYQPRSYERSLFVYMELMTTYKLNLINQQSRRYYELSEEKYMAAMKILNEPLAELFGATIIAQMINKDFDRQITKRLILDYKSRHPDSKYAGSFAREYEKL